MDFKVIIASLRTELLDGCRTSCDTSWGGHGEFKISDPFSRLYWVRSGQGAVIYTDKTITLEPGKLFVLPAFKSARYICPKEMDLYWIHFNAKLFGSLEIFDFMSWDLTIPEPSNEDLLKLFGEFFDALKSKRIEDYFYADGVLRRVLGWFSSNSSEYKAQRIEDLQRFLPALVFIEQNLNRSISLKDLTKVVPLQHAYFCDLFSKTMGVSPIEFINIKRIERAQFLMKQPKRPLKEIGSEVGFKDVYYFSRVFKKIVGIAPAHYRAQEQMRS